MNWVGPRRPWTPVDFGWPEVPAVILQSRRDIARLQSAPRLQLHATPALVPGAVEPPQPWIGFGILPARSALGCARKYFQPVEAEQHCWISESNQANHSHASQFASGKEDSGSSPPTQFVNPRDRRKPTATARFRLGNPTPIEPALSSPVVAARAWPLPDAGAQFRRMQSVEAVT